MGDFRNLKNDIAGKVQWNQSKFCSTLVTRYTLPDHKVSNQLKSHSGLPIYPPLLAGKLVAMYDEIRNRSIGIVLWMLLLPSYRVSQKRTQLCTDVVQL